MVISLAPSVATLDLNFLQGRFFRYITGNQSITNLTFGLSIRMKKLSNFSLLWQFHYLFPNDVPYFVSRWFYGKTNKKKT